MHSLFLRLISQIAWAILVELDNHPNVSQAASSTAVLKVIAPDAHLIVLPVERL